MWVEHVNVLKDNYVWILRDAHYAVVIDPGVAAPVATYLQTHQLTLLGIWLTHHHPDHAGGVAALCERWPVPVYGSEASPLQTVTHRLTHQATIELSPFPSFHVLAVPGHTLDHVAFYHRPYLFCGDTLFTAGCGRLFEGTAEQLYQALMRLKSLGDDTQIYCGHEYTLENLRFAQTVEPNNTAIRARLSRVQALRAQGLPTVPATMAEECQTNPFLRCDTPEVIKTLQGGSTEPMSSIQRFAQLRHWKDHYRPTH